MGRLEPGDFRLDAEIPHVVVAQSEGGRNAAIPLLDEGIAATEAYIEADAFGTWNPEAANKALIKAAEAAGLPAFTTYQMRHSFASGLRQSGADIADIQDMYGHTNAEMMKRVEATPAAERRKSRKERVTRRPDSHTVTAGSFGWQPNKHPLNPLRNKGLERPRKKQRRG